MDFHSLTRKELQFLCKKNHFPANATTAVMANALQALEAVEGIEELQETTGFQLTKVISSEIQKKQPLPTIPLPRTRRAAAKVLEVAEIGSKKEIQESFEPLLQKVKSQEPKHSQILPPRSRGSVLKASEEAEIASKEETQEAVESQLMKMKSPEPEHPKRRVSTRLASSGEEANLPRRGALKAAETADMDFKEETKGSMKANLLEPSQVSRSPVASDGAEPKIQKPKKQRSAKTLEVTEMTLLETQFLNVKESQSLKIKLPELSTANRRTSARVPASEEPLVTQQVEVEGSLKIKSLKVRSPDPPRANRRTSARISASGEPSIPQQVEIQYLKIKSPEPPRANRRISARVSASDEPSIQQEKPSPRKRRSAKAMEVAEKTYTKDAQEEFESQSSEVKASEPPRANRKPKKVNPGHQSCRSVEALEVIVVASDEETQETLEIEPKKENSLEPPRAKRRISARDVGIVEEFNIHPQEQSPFLLSSVRRKAGALRPRKDKDKSFRAASKAVETKDKTVVGAFTRRTTRLSSREAGETSTAEQTRKGVLEAKEQIKEEEKIEHRKKKQVESSIEKVEFSSSKVEVENGNSNDELVDDKEQNDHGFLSSLDRENESSVAVPVEEDQEKDENYETVEDHVVSNEEHSMVEAEKINLKAVFTEDAKIYAFCATAHGLCSSLNGENESSVAVLAEEDEENDQKYETVEDHVVSNGENSMVEAEKSNHKAVLAEDVEIHDFSDIENKILPSAMEEENSSPDAQNFVPLRALIEEKFSNYQQENNGSSLTVENLKNEGDKEEYSGKELLNIEFTEISGDLLLENKQAEVSTSQLPEIKPLGDQLPEKEPAEVSANQLPENDPLADQLLEIDVMKDSINQSPKSDLFNVAGKQESSKQLKENAFCDELLVPNFIKVSGDKSSANASGGLLPKNVSVENVAVEDSVFHLLGVELVENSSNQLPVHEAIENSCYQCQENHHADVSSDSFPMRLECDQLPAIDHIHKSGNHEAFHDQCPEFEPVDDSSNRLAVNVAMEECLREKDVYNSEDKFIGNASVEVFGGVSKASASSDKVIYSDMPSLNVCANLLGSIETNKEDAICLLSTMLTPKEAEPACGNDLPEPTPFLLEETVNLQGIVERVDIFISREDAFPSPSTLCSVELAAETVTGQALSTSKSRGKHRESSGVILKESKEVIFSVTESIDAQQSSSYSPKICLLSTKITPNKAEFVCGNDIPIPSLPDATVLQDIVKGDDVAISGDGCSSPSLPNCSENFAAEIVAIQASSICKSRKNSREISECEPIIVQQNSSFSLEAKLCSSSIPDPLTEISNEDSLSEFLLTDSGKLADNQPVKLLHDYEILQGASFDPQIPFSSSELQPNITISESPMKLQEIQADQSNKIPDISVEGSFCKTFGCLSLRKLREEYKQRLKVTNSKIKVPKLKFPNSGDLIANQQEVKQRLKETNSKIKVPKLQFPDSGNLVANQQEGKQMLKDKEIREVEHQFSHSCDLIIANEQEYKQRLKETNNETTEAELQFSDSSNLIASHPVDILQKTETLHDTNISTTDPTEDFEQVLISHSAKDDLNEFQSKDRPFHEQKKFGVFKSLERMSLRQLREQYKQSLIRTQTEQKKKSSMINLFENCQQRLNEDNLIKEENSVIRITEDCQQGLMEEPIKVKRKFSAQKQEDLDCHCKQKINEDAKQEYSLQKKEKSVIRITACQQSLSVEQNKVERKISALKQEDLDCLSRGKQIEDAIKLEKKRTPLKDLNYHSFC